MAEGLIWVVCISAVLGVLLWRCLPARRAEPSDGPTGPPADPEARAHRQGIKDAARADMDVILSTLGTDDPAGSVAAASNEANEDR